MKEITPITSEDVRRALGERRADAHKGDNGKGLLLAGSDGFSGAAVMAATAALRGGVGTLKVLCPAALKPAFYALPEAMVHTFAGGWDALSETLLETLLMASDCVAIGPGIGKSEGVLRAIRVALKTRKPAVIDADGLNMLSRVADKASLLHENVVLTPHYGEMARLTGLDIAAIKTDPVSVARTCATQWHCVVLLKGAQSVLAAPDGECRINKTGNAGLAKGGSGDVLTGITLAMLGQGLPPFAAACAGAYLLGASADEAVRLLGVRMLMARDVTDVVALTLGRLESEEKP